MQEQESGPPEAEGRSAQEPAGARVADLLREYRDDVLADWERSTRALHTDHAVAGLRLLDHIPELLDRLAEALDTASE